MASVGVKREKGVISSVSAYERDVTQDAVGRTTNKTYMTHETYRSYRSYRSHSSLVSATPPKNHPTYFPNVFSPELAFC